MAQDLNLAGMDITPLILSRIEQNLQHVADGELVMLAKYLQLSIEWLCGERLRLARALQSPPLKQSELAEMVRDRGMKMTPLIILRIETNQRHLCDAELYMLTKVLNVSMAWLCGETELFDFHGSLHATDSKT